MIEVATAPTANVMEVPVAAWLTENAVTDTSIARYVAAGDRMLGIADVGLKSALRLSCC